MRAHGWMGVLAWGVLCLAVAGAPWAAAQAPTVLHSFTGIGTDGEGPYDSALVVGNTLYGTTTAGGLAGRGTVFSIRTDGTLFQVLHSFLDTPWDGAFPTGSLILIGNRLYGMTTSGGGDGVNYWGLGTIFSIQTNGLGFKVHRSFSGLDGAMPNGSLLYWNKRLYGLAMLGGSGGLGTLFSLRTDGKDFRVHRHFTNADGGMPVGSLIVAGSRFFGTAWVGGGFGRGTVFSIGTKMTGFRVEHHFAGQGGLDGDAPRDSLTLVGDRLFGTTSRGGQWDTGTIFSLKTDGTSYVVHHEFPLADGTFQPDGTLLVGGERLYGFASAGQDTLFSLKTDGTDFQIHHVFAAAEGTLLLGSPAIAGGMLYGMAAAGGTVNGGTVFRMVAPVPDIIVDNADANTLSYALWGTISNSQSWEADSLVSQSGKKSQFFWFLPPQLVEGYYRVYAWWSDAPERPARASYYVRHAADVAICDVSQQWNGGQWNELGVFRFLPTRQAYVTLRADKKWPTSVDAVRFEYLGPNPPPP